MENEARDVCGVLYHYDVVKHKYSISEVNQFKLI